MRTLKINLLALTLLVTCLTLASGITSFTGRLFNANGTPLTNAFTMQAWPPNYTWTVYGTNIVYGGAVVTNTPDATGYFSNSAYASSYRFYFTALNSYFYGTLPDTTNVIPLALFLTNAPFTANPLGFYGFITNALGFQPANASNLNASWLLSGTAPDARLSANITRWTNHLVVTISNGTPDSLALGQLTNADGSLWYAISNVAPWHLPTQAEVDSAKPFLITNLAGIDAVKPNLITNLTTFTAYAGFTPVANTQTALTNLIGRDGVINLIGYDVPANSSMGIINALGYTPPVMLFGSEYSIVTNTKTWWISTNLATGIAPNSFAPNGSLLVSSNGAAYTRSNNVWMINY